MILNSKLQSFLQEDDKGKFAVVSAVSKTKVYLDLAENVTINVNAHDFPSTEPKLGQKIYFSETGDVVMTQDPVVDTTSKPIRNTPISVKTLW